MLTKRVIACLDVRDGAVVKGVGFVDLANAGDPDGQAYDREGIDEVIVLDVTATLDDRRASPPPSGAWLPSCSFRSRLAAASGRWMMGRPCSLPAPTKSVSTARR